MNVLLIMADEHRRDALGCAGHPVVQTPRLDALARSGTRFGNAYCNSPLCVPSRASFATGTPVHQTVAWDNGKPYSGGLPSFGQTLSEQGVQVVTVGKLHFDADADTGFSDRRVMRASKMDLEGLRRNPVRARPDGRNRILEAGRGDHWEASTEAETAAAIEFLREEAPHAEKPWVLWLNYLPPHFPLIAPESFLSLYPEDEIGDPIDFPSAAHHPVLEELRLHFDVNRIDIHSARRARAAYYALCSFVDAHVGRVMAALTESGLEDQTLVIYTSDHGEMLGDHELWWKSAMYEPCVGIPLLMRGPAVSPDTIIDTPVSLLDVTATIADAVGVQKPSHWWGQSLLPAARKEQPLPADRAVFSEYHAHGVSHAIFMLRKGRFKYVHYVGSPAQLFDLEQDPHEMDNLALKPQFQSVARELQDELRSLADLERLDEQAHRDQEMRLRQNPIFKD